ncbi:MAG: 50S ribosomal protein L29 [bacterium]|nr:50S ribosomal protein L29 [bacterium]
MKPKEIRSMTVDEIEGKITEFQDKQFKQRIQKSLGQAENPYKLKSTRKDIARLVTILAEKKRSNDGKA